MFKRSTLFATVLVTAGLAALPSAASASCQSEPSVPDCVNYAVDTAVWAVDYAQDTFNYTVMPAVRDQACVVLFVATGRRCE